MKTMPLLRDAWFYPALFAGWCMMMLAVHGEYQFAGLPLPSTSEGDNPLAGFQKQQDIQATIAELKKGLNGALPVSEQGQIVHNIGSAYYDLFRGSQNRDFLDSAFGYYSKSISLVDSIPRFHYNLGRAYMESKNFIQAKTCFEKALALNPDHMMALHNLGIMDFYQFKDDSCAERLLEHEMRIGGQDLPTCNYILGEIALDRGDDARALELFQKEVAIYTQKTASQASPAEASTRRFAVANACRNLAILYSTKYRNQQQAESYLNGYMQFEQDDVQKQQVLNEIGRYWNIHQ